MYAPKERRRSSCIRDIIVRNRYDYVLKNVVLTHKITGESHSIEDITTRPIAALTHMGWFDLPSGHLVYVRLKFGDDYQGKPNLRVPNGPYRMDAEVVRWV